MWISGCHVDVPIKGPKMAEAGVTKSLQYFFRQHIVWVRALVWDPFTKRKGAQFSLVHALIYQVLATLRWALLYRSANGYEELLYQQPIPFLNKGLLRHPVSSQLDTLMALELAHPNSLITLFPTCQVRVVRFYVSCLLLRLLFFSSSSSSSPTSMM